jgi:hypothetical protein
VGSLFIDGITKFLNEIISASETQSKQFDTTMKKFLIITLLSFLGIAVNAQSAVAKIKYEQAEEAFLKNDYRATLTKLDEAKKILGASNPKILYLCLMADKGIIAGGKYDYDLLVAARKDAQYYIKQYSEIEGIEEKFREVYEFSESLETLPKTKELFEQKEAEAAQKLTEWTKTRPIVVCDSLMTAFGVKKCVSVQEFRAYNPSAFSGLKKDSKFLPKGISSLYTNGFNYASSGPGSIYFNDKGLFVYQYIVQGETDPEKAKKVYQSLIDLFPVGMDNEAATRKEITTENGSESGWLTLLGPATGNRGSIMIFYFSMYGKARVEINFHPQ